MQEATTRFVDGRLYSCDYNDFYASKDAVEECHRVHIGPAEFAERMARSTTFTVFEFGLGAGINFLATADLFLKQAPSGARLRFFSTEARPLPQSTVEHVVSSTTSGLTLALDWVRKYPPAISGIHRRLFADHRIELTMMYCSTEDAVNDFLERDNTGVDAWILDGFAPDRNPDMWSDKLLGSLAPKSSVGATATTYSVAGHVRRSLSERGFNVTKVPSLPYKRHTTLATLATGGIEQSSTPGHATVVGGGIAGCATAGALARRGVQVEVRTPTGQVADATSAIPTAIVHARLSASSEPSSRFRVHSYTYSQPLVSAFPATLQCGAIQFPNSRMSKRRLNEVANLLGTNWAIPKSNTEIRELTGCSIDMHGIHFPRSLSVDGGSLCENLVGHPNIRVLAGWVGLQPEKDHPTIFATRSHEPFAALAPNLEIALLEGQVDEFGASADHALPSVAMLIDGYIAPSKHGIVAGSTYEYTPWPKGISTARNLKRVVDSTGIEEWSHTGSFRAKRAITSDHLPVAGKIGPDLWINLAHGSSGMTSAPYCGEIVASLILGELPPAPHSLIEVIEPGRFERRQEKRPNPFLTSQYRARP